MISSSRASTGGPASEVWSASSAHTSGPLGSGKSYSPTGRLWALDLWILILRIQWSRRLVWRHSSHWLWSRWGKYWPSLKGSPLRATKRSTPSRHLCVSYDSRRGRNRFVLYLNIFFIFRRVVTIRDLCLGFTHLFCHLSDRLVTHLVISWSVYGFGVDMTRVTLEICRYYSFGDIRIDTEVLIGIVVDVYVLDSRVNPIIGRRCGQWCRRNTSSVIVIELR